MVTCGGDGGGPASHATEPQGEAYGTTRPAVKGAGPG